MHLLLQPPILDVPAALALPLTLPLTQVKAVVMDRAAASTTRLPPTPPKALLSAFSERTQVLIHAASSISMVTCLAMAAVVVPALSAQGELPNPQRAAVMVLTAFADPKNRAAPLKAMVMTNVPVLTVIMMSTDRVSTT